MSPKREGVPVLDLDIIEYERNCRNIVLLEHCYLEGQQGEMYPEIRFRADDVGGTMSAFTVVFI